MLDHTNNQTKQEYIEALMMDAVDGTLSKTGKRELDSFLAADPRLAEELMAMQAVESFFAQPQVLIEPPADFVQNTMAQLPNLTVRKWATGLIGALAIVLGLFPLALITFLFSNMPAQTAILDMTEVLLSGITQLILGIVDYTAEQPLTWVIPTMMLGSILLWFTLYRRMVGSFTPAHIKG